MRRDRFVSLGLFFVTFAIFGGLISANFVQWDDDINVYQNPHIQGLDWERLRWMFTDVGQAMRYKPLTWLCYALIYHWCGLNPFGYHLVNVLLHCVNSVLVFEVLRRLLAAGARRSPEEMTLPAAAGALLWAIHPLRVEPVAWVTDLSYCLSVCFLLISTLFYLRACQVGTGTGRRPAAYWFSVAAYGLVMLTHPVAFTWGIVLVILDWYPLRRFGSGAQGWRDPAARRIWFEKVPFLLLGGLIFTTFLSRMHPAGTWAEVAPDKGLHLFRRSMQALYVWAYYGWKPWAPFHLSPLYLTLLNFNPATWPFLLSAVLVSGTTALLAWNIRRWPCAMALWAGHLVLLVPALGLTEQQHFTSDRYDYLPGLVWAMAIAAVLWKMSARPKRLAAGITCATVLAVFWAGLSWRQLPVWRDSPSLFGYMIAELGDDPYRGDLHWRLGWFYATEGKTDEAVRQYQASLRIQPAPETYRLLGQLLEKNGNAEGALTNYLAVLRFGPNPAIQIDAAVLLSGLGRSREAMALYRQVLKSSPDLVPALNNLAWILATDPETNNRSGAEAVRFAERACALTRRQVPILLGTLAAAYAEAGRFSEAVQTAQSARDLAAASGQSPLAGRFQKLMELYQSGRPFREGGNQPGNG